MENDHFSPPGSSTYSSDIFHAGDGTWDSSRDLFLLPNVMGLPFDVMRLNGMGNRFAGLAEYQTIILGHGILAAITFLFIVPIAITTACFYHANPRLALQIHIALQTLTVILVTVVFLLGYFAVGPERSLSNPHHCIGLALFVLILVQGMGGWIIKKIEKGKMRYHIPLKLMLHQWVGRAIALLALAQIPIGLTLYGSPAYLFVLYSLVMAFWIILYFFLTYRAHVRSAMAPYEAEGSYVTGGGTAISGATSVSQHPDRHKLEALAATVGLGAAIAAFRRRRSQREHRRTESSSGMIPRPTGSEYSDKWTESRFSDDDRRRPKDNTWRNRLLGGAAALGVAGLAERFISKRDEPHRHESRSDISYNRPPLGGPVPAGSESNLTRMEEGVPTTYQPPSDHWQDVEDMGSGRVGPGRPDMRSEASYFSDYTPSNEPDRRQSGWAKFGLGAVGGAAGLGAIRGWLNRRRSQKEERRQEPPRRRQEDDNNYESTYGPATTRYTDDSPRKAGRHHSPTTEVTQTNTDYNRHLGAGAAMASGALPGSVMAPPHPPPSNIPPPPHSSNMPPPPPAHQQGSFSTLPSQEFDSPTPRRQPRRYSDVSRAQGSIVHDRLGGSNASGSFPGSGVLSPPPPINPDGQTGSPDSRGNVASPSISVNVKVAPDGRHVTLRRLNEEEAAQKRAQQERTWRREKRTRDNSQSRSNLSPGHVSQPSASGGPTPGRSPLSMPGAPAGNSPVNSYLEAAHGIGDKLTAPGEQEPGNASPGAMSPGGVEGSNTNSFDENRRRRRAERARAEQARQRGAKGKTGKVEFTDFD